MKSTFQAWARVAVFLLLGGAVAAASAAPVRVEIDTASLGVSDGFLELQLSATSGASLVTAEVTSFTGFAVGSLQAADSWGYSAITGGYELRNDTPNDVLHAVHFGAVLSFLLDLSGNADAGYVTHFTVSLWDASFNALGSPSPANNAVLDLAWLPQASSIGGVATAAYQSAQVTLVQPVVASTVPEPATAWLLLPALVLLGLGRRRCP